MALDIQGKRFGRLVVQRRGESRVLSSGMKRRQWVCRCDCGREVSVYTGNLTSGHTQSCGCLHDERFQRAGAVASTKHGRWNTPEYRAWSNMKQRCYNPKVKRYSRYGARGIRVCKRWLHSFKNFFADLGPRPSAQHSLDRKDNDGDYTPSNTRWATDAQQRANRKYSANRGSFR